MKKILIDCTLTGGRGPAKKVSEFIWDCKKNNIPYFLVADKKLSLILKKLSVRVDRILPISINMSKKEVYSIFEKEFNNISYDILVKFGARTPGPYTCLKQKKPYIIVDGGLPDKYEEYPSLYDKETYIKANKYIVTSNFPWKPSPPTFLKNVKVCYFPISDKTRKYLQILQKKDKPQIIKELSEFFTPIPNKFDVLININMTDDYVSWENRTTYGGWLKTKQYDQVVGYLRRLITDLAISKKQIAIILDKKILEVCSDIFKNFKNITPVTWKSDWNYYAEIASIKVASLVISRAANYQPFVFSLYKGCNITTAVPADGYMNEDNAAIQANALGLTYQINYDDEECLKKTLSFIKDKEKIASIVKKQQVNFLTFGKEKNCNSYLFKLIKNFK